MKIKLPSILQVLASIVFLLVGVHCDQKSKSNGDGRLQIESLSAGNSWPGATWQESPPESQGMQGQALQKLIDYSFQKSENEEERKGIRTDSLLIIRNGKLVLEKYDRHYTKKTPHLAWSISKSFVNAIYGIAVEDGLVKIDYPAAQYYPLLNKPQKRAITLRHMLNMSSGLFWQEDYEYAPLKSTVVAMLYTRGRQDMAAFTASQEMRTNPGTFLYYSSGESNLLMGILKNVLKDQYNDYPFERLFKPLGMQSVVWEQDASGTYVGSSYIYCTPRDLARFGYLYLNDGVWQGKRILPVGWVDFTRTPAPAHGRTEARQELLDFQMSAHWYTNLDIPNTVYSSPWPDAPKDTFAALGHWGQRLFVIPSLNMVVVRFGDDRDGSFDINRFLKLVKDTVQ